MFSSYTRTHRSPVQWAAILGEDEISVRMVRMGASLTYKDTNRRTSLDLAKSVDLRQRMSAATVF